MTSLIGNGITVKKFYFVIRDEIEFLVCFQSDLFLVVDFSWALFLEICKFTPIRPSPFPTTSFNLKFLLIINYFLFLFFLKPGSVRRLNNALDGMKEIHTSLLSNILLGLSEPSIPHQTFPPGILNKVGLSKPSIPR